MEKNISLQETNAICVNAWTKEYLQAHHTARKKAENLLRNTAAVNTPLCFAMINNGARLRLVEHYVPIRLYFLCISLKMLPT